MSTTTSARFISGPAPARSARWGLRGARHTNRRAHLHQERERKTPPRPVTREALVGAGLRGAGLVSRSERLAATAARDSVRVAQGEASAHQRVDEVDLGALEVHGAHRVDDDANAVLHHDRVILFGAVGEGHPIREARASTRRHIHPEGEILPLLLREHLAELVRRLRGQRNEWGLDRRRALLDRQVSTSVRVAFEMIAHELRGKQVIFPRLDSNLWGFPCITRKCSIRLARKPELASSTERPSGSPSSSVLRRFAIGRASGMRRRPATSTSRPIPSSAYIRADISRCGWMT